MLHAVMDQGCGDYVSLVDYPGLNITVGHQSFADQMLLKADHFC